MNAVATPAPFDASIAEDAINKVLEKALGGMYGTLESTVPGVVAFDRIDGFNKPLFDWNDLACAVARDTGYTLLCIANADWQTDDGPDEEATYFAFAVPDLDSNYVDPYRNLIDGPITPTTATAEDFENWRTARTYLEGRFEELKGKMKYATGEEFEAAKLDSANLIRVGETLRAWDKEIVAGLLAHDLAQALAAKEAQEAADEAKDEPMPTPSAVM